MTWNAGQMKDRMRDDLRVAIKSGRAGEAALIRALIAALDNAEAPPLPSGQTATDQHKFRDGSAEIARLALSGEQVRAVLLREVQERENAAAEMHRLDKPDRADILLTEAQLTKRYIEE